MHKRLGSLLWSLVFLLGSSHFDGLMLKFLSFFLCFEWLFWLCLLGNVKMGCSLRWWLGNGRSFRKQLKVFAKGWRFTVKNKSEAQSFLNQDLADIVKGSETVASITKQYGVSMRSIAIADRNILDIAPVFKGHLLDIPASSSSDAQLSKESQLTCYEGRDRPHGFLNVLDRFRTEKHFVMLTSHGLPHVHPAQSTGYILVMVTLIALCIRCIIAVLRTRVTKDLTSQGSSGSRKHQHRTRSTRWKYALSDTGDPGQIDSDSSQGSDETSADEDKNAFEALPDHEYGKLQHDYQKFLGECGISNYGYWRGGSGSPQ